MIPLAMHTSLNCLLGWCLKAGFESSFEQNMISLRPRCYIKSFMEIGSLVPRRFLKGFNIPGIWA